MTTSISEARLQANRVNAQLSTGPKTDQGKQTSSKNALKTALTGRTVLLLSDDADRYERHLEHYRKLWQPVGEHEPTLVQAIADAWWRLERIPGLEEGLYAKGCAEFQEQVAEIDPAARAITLRTHIYLAYEKQFRNLALQERRLHNYATNLKAELEQVQKRRDKKEAEDLAMAATLYKAAEKEGKTYNPEEDGFEFSTDDVRQYLRGFNASGIAAFEPANQPRTEMQKPSQGA